MVDVRQMFLDWLTSHLATVEVVGTKSIPWCAHWWLHPGEVARFKALWHAIIQVDASVMDGDPEQGHLYRRKGTTARIVPALMPPNGVEL